MFPEPLDRLQRWDVVVVNPWKASGGGEFFSLPIPIPIPTLSCSYSP